MGIGKTLMNMEMLKFLRARASKIIPCVVFNKIVHIIHSSPSMPFYRTLPMIVVILPSADIKVSMIYESKVILFAT